MDESMSDMKEDISRYRQIMENIDQIYVNKKSGIGDRNTGVPEAPKTTDFKPEIGGPFEGKAKFEANRDNKENAKNFKGQGGPFEKNGEVDNSDMESDKAPKGSSQGDKLGQPFTDAAQYVPDGSVANMHPKGGEVVRVNEDINFEEENPDLAGDEYSQISPESEELSADEILSSYDDEEDEKPEFGNDFWREMDPEYARTHGEEGSHLAGDNEGIAGIDDMSGINREDILNGAVNEAVNTIIKRKNLDLLAESIASELLKEDGYDRGQRGGDEGDRYFKYDSDFRFKGPKGDNNKGREVAKGLSRYMASETNREKNLHKNKETGEMEYTDDAPDAPTYINPYRVEYDKTSPYYGENKYGLNLNDDPKDDEDDAETRQGAWETTKDVSRKFQNAFLAQGAAEMFNAGADIDSIDVDKIAQTFRHGVFILQKAKNSAAEELGIGPRMIENFLSGNFEFGQENVSDEDSKKQVWVDQRNNSGYRDAKISRTCIILPEGELDYTKENIERVKEEYGDVITGPSLKAVGYTNEDGSDLSTQDLEAFVDDCLRWDKKWGEVMDTEEETMKSIIEHLNSITDSEVYKNAKSKNMESAISQWYSLIEEFGALQSLVIIPIEVLNRRDDAKDLAKYGHVKRGGNVSLFGRFQSECRSPGS